MSYSRQPNQPPPGRQRKRGNSRRRAATPPGAYQPGYQQPPPYSTPPPGGPGRASSKARRPRRRGRRGFAIGPGCIFGCIGFVGVVVLGMLITAFVVYDYYSGQLEDEIEQLEDLTDYRSSENTVILDRRGDELYKVFDEGLRTLITLDQIPQHMIDATISIEDDTFYENRGIDIPSILRAGWQYVRHGYIVSGGSTITQQLIRNVLFSEEYKNERSLNRKLDEALLAVILTQRMGKDEILEMYLNEIYYGHLAYGVEAAAQTYFGKSAVELTLGEAALLAGLPQAPADLDPLNPDPNVQRRVSERRKLVLNLMVEEGYITRAEADAALAEPLIFVSPDIELESAPHLVVYAQDELEDLLMRELNLSQDEIKKMIARGGLRVYTSVDMDMQRMAENVARQQVDSMRVNHNMNNAAMIVLRPDTGEILAMVGSVNYEDEAIDGNVNVTIAARQPGSAMKPFTYAAALENGWSAATVIWDTETRIGISGQPEYVPNNYDNRFHGPVRVREALANSYNIPAVQTLRQVGVDYLLWMMHRVGVQSLSADASQYGLSLTLGGGEVTPLELTTAYAVLANGGVYVPSTSILCVTDSEGAILYEYERRCPTDQTRLTDSSRSVLSEGRQVMDPRIAFVISHILADNNARTPAMGSSSPLYTPGVPTSVKTGTTNDYRDNWTVGFTRNIAVGVWAGNTDNTPMTNVSGLDGAAPIWNSVMTGIYQNPALLNGLGGRPPDDAHLQPPGGVSQRQFCNLSRTALQDPATSCTPSYTEWMLDSPAAVPDSQGRLVAPQPTQPPPQSTNGPQPVEIEPGLIRVHVVPVVPEMANAIAATDTSGHTVPPRYCQVPIEVVGALPNVQEQLFIAPPPVAEDAFRARMWAHANGVAILPQFACNEQMLQAVPSAAASESGLISTPGITAYISSPGPTQPAAAGQELIITGTATVPGGGWYMVQIRGGPWADWTTLSDVGHWTHQRTVQDDVLDSIMAGALGPGSYELKLSIVSQEGQILAEAVTGFAAG